MADIKTRDVVKGTIKTVDRAAIAERRMKQSYLLTKDKAKQFDKMSGASETEYASEQVEQKTETVAKHVVQRIDQKGRKGFEFTRGNIRTRMKGSDEKNKNFLRKRAKGSNDKKVQGDENALNKGFNLMGKKVDKTSKNKASKDIKTAKAPQKPINYIKSTIKDAEQTTETTRKTIAASSRVSKGVTQVAKSVTRTITSGAKTVAKATTKAVRATMTTAKMSVAAIAAGGWAAIVAIVVICLSALLLGSVFGIFFAGEDTGTGQTIQTVVREINSDYDDKLMSIRDKSSYEVLEMKGSRAVWKEVLAVYSVKVNTDPDNPQEVVTMDDAKKKLLKTIFWDMNNISKSVETRTETVTKESTDEQGNKIETTEQVKKKYLVITLTGKTADDMANSYSFNDTQKKYLAELMSDKNNKLWASLIYNIGGVSGGSGIDIKDLDFSNETVNDTQKKIVAVATNSAKYGISARSGYCQAWVADVYQAVTGSRGSAHCALCAADMWAVSSDWSKIPVGAAIYGYSSSKYGHVGIYIGNGMVAHNIGYIKIEPIEDWIKTYKGFAWGWENGYIKE